MSQPNHLREALLVLAERLEERTGLLEPSDADRARIVAACRTVAEALTGETAADAGDAAAIDEQVIRQMAARSILGSVFCAQLTGETEYLARDVELWSFWVTVPPAETATQRRAPDELLRGDGS